MILRWLLIFEILQKFHLSLACIATGNGNEGGFVPLPCLTCQLNRITLTAGTDPDVTPTASAPVMGLSGCRETTVTCTFPVDTTGTMQFNNAALNADTKSVALSIHKLICQYDGNFAFIQNDIATSITEISCISDIVIKPPCQTSCTLSDVILTMSATSTLTASTPVIGGSECLEIVINCAFATNTKGTMNLNNGAIIADATAVATSTHTLICQNDGSFAFVQNGADTIITEVSCASDPIIEPLCQTTCSLSDITLSMGTTSTLTASEPTIGDSDCLETTINCVFATNTNGIMNFNNGALAADATAVATSSHTLICQDDGSFAFIQNGVPTAITEVSCEAEDNEPTCEDACTLSSLTLSPGEGPGTQYTPTASSLAVGDSGCAETAVSCPFDAGTNGLMTFNNDAIYADEPFVDMSSHTLVCQANGEFSFEKDGTTSAVSEVSCLTPPCNTDYLTFYTQWEEPEYVMLQLNGSLTLRCADPEAMTVTIQTDGDGPVFPFPENPDKTQVTLPLECDPTTGKYCIRFGDTCNVQETIGCCPILCPLLPVVGSGETSNFNTDSQMSFTRFPACPMATIDCRTIAQGNSATILINGQPIKSTKTATRQDLLCDNDSKNWIYDGQPVTSVGCLIGPPPACGMGCDASTLILTTNEAVGPTPFLTFVTDLDGCTNVQCVFAQPRPTGILRFNNGALIPSNTPVFYAEYTLICQPDNMSWGYVNLDGTTTTVTEVSCQAS